MHTSAWLPFAGLPVLTGAGILMAQAEPGTWSALPRPVLWRIAGDALLVNAAIVVIGAPLCGVAMVSRRAGEERRRPARSLPSVALTLGALAAVYVGASAAVTLTGFGVSSPAPRFVAASHLTLFTAAMALAALGAWTARAFRDPLDAAAVSTGVALAASFGILLAGPHVQVWSHGLVNAALLASPVVATASAANIDIARTDLLYQLSPLSGRRFDYPLWHIASGLYAATAALCFGGMTWTAGRTRPFSAKG